MIYINTLDQTDSKRIRKLNKLSRNQSDFLRLLKQTFINPDIAIKQQHFILLDRDSIPSRYLNIVMVFKLIKLMDHEDGLPLYLYTGLISGDELKPDYLNIISELK
jgi:hypothetical protein